MEHMVNFGIVIDDESIEQMVKENVVKQVSSDILKKLEKDPGDLPVTRSNIWNAHTKKIDWQKLVKQAVEELAEEWKDDIVERTAELLYESLKRSKKYKDKIAEVLDD